MIRTTAPITNQEDIDKLLLVEGRIGMFIHFGLFTALRISEILSLKWEQVFVGGCLRGEIVIRRLKKRKENSSKIGVSEPLKRRLESYYEEIGCPNMGVFIFPGRRRNSHITKEVINSEFKSVVEGLKIETRHPTSHLLRKTFARRFFESQMKKGDLRALQKTMLMLGKTSERDTLRYIGVEEDNLINDFKQFNYE